MFTVILKDRRNLLYAGGKKTRKTQFYLEYFDSLFIPKFKTSTIHSFSLLLLPPPPTLTAQCTFMPIKVGAMCVSGQMAPCMLDQDKEWPHGQQAQDNTKSPPQHGVSQTKTRESLILHLWITYMEIILLYQSSYGEVLYIFMLNITFQSNREAPR